MSMNKTTINRWASIVRRGFRVPDGMTAQLERAGFIKWIVGQRGSGFWVTTEKGLKALEASQ